MKFSFFVPDSANSWSGTESVWLSWSWAWAARRVRAEAKTWCNKVEGPKDYTMYCLHFSNLHPGLYRVRTGCPRPLGDSWRSPDLGAVFDSSHPHCLFSTWMKQLPYCSVASMSYSYHVLKNLKLYSSLKNWKVTGNNLCSLKYALSPIVIPQTRLWQ